MTSFKLRYGVARAQGSRPHQEDEFTCIDNLTVGRGPALFSVYDGHGSDNVSADASNHVYESILASKLIHNNPDQAIRDAFKAEDEHLNKFLSKLRADRAGSTATVALVTPDKIHLGNVGDSRAVMGYVNSAGLLSSKRLSKDHHLDDPEEKRRIVSAGGLVLQGRVVGEEAAINMSRALGDLNFKTPLNHAQRDFITSDAFICEPEAITKDVQFLILASDGLWNEIDDDLKVVQQVNELRKSGLGPDQIARHMADYCARFPNSDNVTVIVVFFEWGGQTFPSEDSATPGLVLMSEHRDATAQV